VLFTTPLLNALGHAFPAAEIDVVIGARACVPLIEGLPRVRRVLDCPRKLLRQPVQLWCFRKRLNERHYDVLIAPSLVSTSDKLVALLVRAPFKLGFTQKGTFSPITHSRPQPTQIAHEALKPLELLALLGAHTPAGCRHLNVRLNKDELLSGSQRLPRLALGFFRGARSDKCLPSSWWRNLIRALRKLDDEIEVVEIVAPSNQERLSPSIPAIWEPNLRRLASILANLSGLVSGDTGIMHLASAAGTPTMALFKTTAPRKFGPLGMRDLSLVIRDRPIEAVARELLRHQHALEPKHESSPASHSPSHIPIAYREAQRSRPHERPPQPREPSRAGP
jgi:ADP-heptose:LPS heptosyltransferase